VEPQQPHVQVGAEHAAAQGRLIDLRRADGRAVNFTDGRYSGFGFGDFLLGLSSNQGLTLFREPTCIQTAGNSTVRIRGGSRRT